jgi:hypothetical protein
MDVLTTKQKYQMCDEISELVLKYSKDKTAKRMIASFFQEVQKVETSKELISMSFVLTSLRYLLEITFPTK